MRVAVIVNPISGRRGSRRHTGSERRAYAEAWLAHRAVNEAEVAVTTGRGHAAELARRFVGRGFDRVAAWGGDGTANEVAGPLVGSGVVLALIRAGSGDGFARGLGIPRSPDDALAIAVGPSVHALDVGWLGNRHFLNIGGFGFDASIGRGFNARRTRGVLGYLTGGLGGVWSYRSAPYELDLDGVRLEGERFLVAFANGSQYGNGMMLFPEADPADGILDALVVDTGSPLRQIWRARRLFVSPGRPAQGLTRFRVRSATVTGPDLLVHADGEVFETSGTVKVAITPGTLIVAVPGAAQAYGSGLTA